MIARAGLARLARGALAPRGRTAALGAPRVALVQPAAGFAALRLREAGVRAFSSGKNDDEDADSHPDFATQRKTPAESEDGDVQEFLAQAVKDHDVLLFMKGVPQAPRCGFSMQAVRILQEEGVDFSSADVLSSDEIREGIKKFSDWPTIPQLYVNGDFVGGCDIITEMHKSGELKELLADVLAKQKAKDE
mmetsp:Transcript_15270/g.43312  ORF Transcript_15270/g.43312 Transcript_15270/m.43312 type:complete len:191 (-) Transcript_15270:326-898(-)